MRDMPIQWRKSWRFGIKYLHIRMNWSRAGTSWSYKVGPWSWNTRTKRHRLDLPGPLFWQGKPKRKRTVTRASKTGRPVERL